MTVALVQSDSATTIQVAIVKKVYGFVNDTSATATSFVGDSSLSANDDAYNGLILQFQSGAQAGQRTRITDYVGATKTFTVDALPLAPADGDLFFIEGVPVDLTGSSIKLRYSVDGAAVVETAMTIDNAGRGLASVNLSNTELASAGDTVFQVQVTDATSKVLTSNNDLSYTIKPKLA